MSLRTIKPKNPFFEIQPIFGGRPQAGMHGRGSGPSAPASDAAGRGDAEGTPQTVRPCHVVPRGFPALTWLKSGRLELYQLKPPKWPVQAETTESGRNSKKKKGAKRTV